MAHHGGKCICDLCVCGRHRCPQQAAKGKGDMVKDTEYTQVYKPHQLSQQANFKPEHQPMQSAEFEGTTTNRRDYTPKPLTKPHVHQHEQYVKPEGQFESDTSYKKDFIPKQGPRAQAIRHEAPRQQYANFEGEPTYKSDYRKWDAARTQPIRNENVWTPPKQPLEGQTTNQNDYKRKDIPPRVSFKPSDQPHTSNDPFADSTGYRDEYQPHQLPKPFVREREQYQGPKTAMDGLTTFRRDYTGPHAPRTDSFKPNARPFQSQEPFEGTTTQRRDYPGYAASKPQLHAHDVYQKPEGEMYMGTTHKDAFKGYPGERVLAKRPSSTKKNDAPFEGTSSYSQDFIPRRGERAQPPRQAEWQPNRAQFEGNSTYANHYVQHSQPMTQSFRPSQAPLRSDAKMDDNTNYRTDYVKREIQPCPAGMLDNPNSTYRFKALNDRGHKVYTATTITPLHMQQQRGGPMALSVA